MPQYLFFNEFDSERQMAKSSPPFFVLLALTGAGIGILATPVAFMAVDTCLQALTINFFLPDIFKIYSLDFTGRNERLF